MISISVVSGLMFGFEFQDTLENLNADINYSIN